MSDTNEEPLRALVAISPTTEEIALSKGKSIVMGDIREGSAQTLIDGSTSGNEEEIITRGIAFSRCGTMLSSGGDDKAIRLWRRDNGSAWTAVKSIKAPKKISAVVFSADGTRIFASTKFGDVMVASTEEDTHVHVGLGHYSSPITSMALSLDGTLLATTDRDGRARLTRVLDNSQSGMHTIQAFCFGHTKFITCCVFLKQGEQEVVMTGSGDGTLRAWDIEDGKEIAMTSMYNGSEKTPLALECSQDGNYIFVVLDGLSKVLVVRLDIGRKNLEVLQDANSPDLHLCTDIARDTLGRVWVVGGPIPGANSGIAVHCLRCSNDGTLREDDVLEKNPLLLAELQAWEGGALSLASLKSFIPAFLHKS